LAACTEETVALLGRTGTPAPIASLSLGEWQLQKEHLFAMASVRQANGKTPTAVLAFLANVVSHYDALGTSVPGRRAHTLHR